MKNKCLFFLYLLFIFYNSCSIISSRNNLKNSVTCDYFLDEVKIIEIDSCCNNNSFKIKIKGKNYSGVIISSFVKYELNKTKHRIKVNDKIHLYLKLNCINNEQKIKKSYNYYYKDSLIWTYSDNEFECYNLNGIYINSSKNVNIDSLNKSIYLKKDSLYDYLNTTPLPNSL